MRSLTGYGSGSAPLGAGRVQIEIRALNHKHQDVRVRLPSELAEHSSFVEQSARADLGRGRYDINVRVEGEISGPPQIDKNKLGALFRSLCEVRDEIAPQAEVALTALLSVPEIYTTEDLEVEVARKALHTAFVEATESLAKMRDTEGSALKTDLVARLKRVRELRAEITEASADLVAHHRTRIRERLDQLLSDQKALSSDRLEQEVALVADRSDITEELVRLESHYAQLQTLLEQDEPAGRRADFLLQEVGREVNTIGSKSQHAPVAHLVVEMKSEVERLREQVQNVD